MARKGEFKHGYSAYSRGLCKCGVCRTAHAKYERERRVRRRKREELEAKERAEKRGLNKNAKMMPRIRLEMLHDTFTRETLLAFREEEYERIKSGEQSCGD